MTNEEHLEFRERRKEWATGGCLPDGEHLNEEPLAEEINKTGKAVKKALDPDQTRK